MDTKNPAVAKHLAIPPQLIEEVKDDPSRLQSVARVMGAVNLHNMFVQVSERDATFQQRVEFQKVVNKIGRLEPTDTQAAGGGFSVTINIPAVGSTSGAVIEAKADVLGVSVDEGVEV